MSTRYEIPTPEDIEAHESKQNAQWKTIAEDATRDDPVFQRWKKRYWTGVWSATILVCCIMFLVGVTLHLETLRSERDRGSRFIDTSGLTEYQIEYFKRLDRDRLSPWDPRLLEMCYFGPVVLASATYGVGAWIYGRKLRSIAVRVWSEQRTAEFEAKKRSIPHAAR